VRVAFFAAMVLGLIGVFVILPRWQDRRRTTIATGFEVQQPTPSPENPIPKSQDPTPVSDPTISEPSPLSTPTHTPRPGPARPRNTPPNQPSTADREYVEAMSIGLAALENRQWQVAQDAFARASRLRPDAPEVADGLARARAGRRRESVADSLRRAREFERNEAWRDAEKMYSSVLAIDPESAPALDGRTRTETRANLDEKLEFHLANPGRLSTAPVFDGATSCLEEALETVPSGPRLEGQIARLETLLKVASTPVAVVLESDASTEVLVYRVGRLGTFTRRELSLKPGTYTVVGSRSGYRDVRLQLVVVPGSRPETFVVRCTESL
jgi:tetratricopeptide (TPR) repeat protein